MSDLSGVYSERKKAAMAMIRNPKLNLSDLALLSLSLEPSSLVIVPFLQADTLISPVISFRMMLIAKSVMRIVAMIFNAPIYSYFRSH